MSISTKLRELNNYPEWKTDAGIDHVIAYVRSLRQAHRVYPAGTSLKKQHRWDSKFSRDFVVVRNGANTVLYYQPSTGGMAFRIRLQVLRPVQKQQAMQDIYDDPQKGLGLGLHLFYFQVVKRYLGITRDEATAFLKSQDSYQLHRPYHKVINKPVLAYTSNQKWGADIFYVKPYGFPQVFARAIRRQYGYQVGDKIPIQENYSARETGRSYLFVLMVVDYYSKKVWARPLTGSNTTEGVNPGGVPQPEEVLEQFTDICQSIHTTPQEFTTDNGSDFVNPAFEAFCNAQHIKHITTSSHTPESNGLVERMNAIMRNKITAGIAHFNELNWSAHLQDYVINMNNQRHIKGKYSADELWTQGFNPPNYNHNRVELDRQVDDHSPVTDLREHHKAQLLHTAYEQVHQDGWAFSSPHLASPIRVKI